MSTSQSIRFILLRSIGNFLVLFAIYGVFMTFGPALYYEVLYRISQIRGVTYTVEAQPSLFGQIIKTQGLGLSASESIPSQLGSVLSGPRDQILIPVDPAFSVLIPKIGANAKVIPNVDANNTPEYLAALKKGIAHARGSVFPGIQGTTYLFAHSTDNFWDVGRYNAIFYLLKDLNVNDQVVVFFKDKRYNYSVTAKKIIAPNDVSYLTKSHQGDEQLVLQTCWPPGTTLQRLLVIAKPVGKL